MQYKIKYMSDVNLVTVVNVNLKLYDVFIHIVLIMTCVEISDNCIIIIKWLIKPVNRKCLQ